MSDLKMSTLPEQRHAIRGRGAAGNPANRFEKIELTPFEDVPVDPQAPDTEYYRDDSKSVLTYNNSPDIGIDVTINPYRGCEHGCIYCYARPYHEDLGFSAGLDFETRIFVKTDAARLLRKELLSPSWTPQTIGLSGITDPYQPAERNFRITRACLQVLADFRNPAGIVTKNYLVTRDIDVLQRLREWNAIVVVLSITTLDAGLARRMEPRASHPERRLKAVRELSAAGIPVSVLIGPVIPGLTDHEMPQIISAAADAGARQAGFTTLRLPHGVGDLFQNWLDRHFPERKEKILNRLRAMHRGKLSSSEFHRRMKGEGVFADQIRTLFQAACRKAGIAGKSAKLSAEHFRRPGAEQLSLFR